MTRMSNISYEMAKRLLRENKDLVLVKYYNGYKNSISLKVIWFVGHEDSRGRINVLRRQLRECADRVGTGSYGGDIYSFAR